MTEPRIVPPRHPIDSLINAAQVKLNLATKTEAIVAVGANASMLSRIRKGTLNPSSDFILSYYDATGTPIEEIRAIAKISKKV